MIVSVESDWKGKWPELRRVWVNDELVKPTPADSRGSRWIGLVGDLCVKVDRSGPCSQSEREFSLWNRVLSGSDDAEAFAATRWFAQVGPFDVVIQERIKRPRCGYTAKLAVQREVHKLFEKYGIQDVAPSQWKLSASAPLGFKIHDYGIN